VSADQPAQRRTIRSVLFRSLTYALADLMRGKAVTCEDRGHDRYRRTIGLCRANGEDLGAAMVSVGMAWAFTRYSSDYVSQEGGDPRDARRSCARSYESVGLAARLPVAKLCVSRLSLRLEGA
jgi:hypothetical protein